MAHVQTFDKIGLDKRNSAHYEREFGSRFVAFRDALRGDHVWFDVGAGHMRALGEFISTKFTQMSNAPWLVGISRFAFSFSSIRSLFVLSKNLF